MKYTQKQLDAIVDACDETAETIHKNFPKMDAMKLAEEIIDKI